MASTTSGLVSCSVFGSVAHLQGVVQTVTCIQTNSTPAGNVGNPLRSGLITGGLDE